MSGGYERRWIIERAGILRHLFAQLIQRDAPTGPPLMKGIPVYVFGRLEVEADIVKFYALHDENAASIAERDMLQHMTYDPSALVELTVFTLPTADLQKPLLNTENSYLSPSQSPFIDNRKTESRNLPS